MRNSNCMALAPTATISNIVGTTPSVEPTFKNIFMKENLSGNFMVINKFLIDALSEVSLWNESTITQMKINNGSILDIDEIPADIRRRFKETFEIDSSWIIKAAAIRGKWIDQAASTNIFMKTNSGKALNQTYTMAWEYGLKTTYYLRSLASSQVTKTVSVQDVVPSSEELPPPKESSVLVNPDIKVCSIIDPDCEACQ